MLGVADEWMFTRYMSEGGNHDVFPNFIINSAERSRSQDSCCGWLLLFAVSEQKYIVTSLRITKSIVGSTELDKTELICQK